MQTYLLDHSHTAIIALDSDLRFQYLNPSAEALLDLSNQRANDMLVANIICQQELHQDLIRALEQKQQFTRRETALSLHHETITADYSVTPLESKSCALLIEIHPRKRLRRITLEESQAVKHETSRILVRGLAHEIKNPLGGIRGAAQLLGRMLKNPEFSDYTQVIIEEADRLRDLVDRMLGPLTPPRIKEINIHEVLERVTQLIEAETRHTLSINRDYDPSIPDLPADRELMIQAVLNLARNAMQAIAQSMPLGNGHITLRSRITRQFTMGSQRRRMVCQLSVIDNGPGIPEHLRENIFYPMISGRADGTGLGLPMTQSIISQHNGLIEWESSPGNTCFHIYLPLQKEQGAVDEH
ncbi:nitrogen regulation protein NR(II) [Endozoicomonas sp.]|nr:nitrogen regulation protein NR(II) [Endozoicomonas sp.]